MVDATIGLVGCGGYGRCAGCVTGAGLLFLLCYPSANHTKNENIQLSRKKS